MKIKGREILIYCFLAYLFSWTYWLTGMLGRNPVHPFNSLGGYGISVGMFGPMLAAVIMRGFISKEGFKGSVGVIRPFKFYVIAYLVPFFFILALIMFNNITGIGRILGLIWACWHLPPLTLAHDSFMVEHSSVSGRSYLSNLSLYLVISCIRSKCFGCILVSLLI